MPAGIYHLVLDCIIIQPVDTTFELIWRRGTTDAPVIAPFTAHYEPLGGGQYAPQPYEYDQTGTAIAFQGGDQLVFRYTASATSDAQVYEPNGDGPGSNGGRIPSITLPP